VYVKIQVEQFKKHTSSVDLTVSSKKGASYIQFTKHNKCSQPETFFSTKEHSGDKKFKSKPIF